jgi:DNA-binding CsgD family transcriptional regulator
MKTTSNLSRRQRCVLQLVAQGMTTDQIAAALGIAPGTVAIHRHHICLRTNSRNVAQHLLRSLKTGGPK